MPEVGRCSGCKRAPLNVSRNRLSGLLQCRGCSRKKEKCIRCGIVKSVGTRKENGSAVCRPCSRALKVKEPCSQCGKLAFLSSNRTKSKGRPICESCVRSMMSFQCGVCQKERSGYPAVRRADGQSVCPSCATAQTSFQCEVCQHERKGYPTKRDDGKPICEACVRVTRSFKCWRCEQEKIGYPNAVTKNGPVCLTCYYKSLNRGKCDFCACIKPIKSIAGGKNRCKDCYLAGRPKAV